MSPVDENEEKEERMIPRTVSEDGEDYDGEIIDYDEEEDENVRDEEGTTAVCVSNIREPSVGFDQVRLLMLLFKNDLQTLPKPTLMEIQERRNSMGLSHCSLSGSSPSPVFKKDCDNG